MKLSKETFEIKRVLDMANKLGDRHHKIDELLTAVTHTLADVPSESVIKRAKEYMLYEMKCWTRNEKPDSIPKWLSRRSKQWESCSISHKPSA